MIRVVRLGTPRAKSEGPRLGTVRRPPRGVKKSEYARRDYYDAWLPDLAPSAKLITRTRAGELGVREWAAFARRYRAEMRAPAAARLIALLAALSHAADFSVGCYCEDQSRCHRSLLRELLEEAGAQVD